MGHFLQQAQLHLHQGTSHPFSRWRGSPRSRDTLSEANDLQFEDGGNPRPHSCITAPLRARPTWDSAKQAQDMAFLQPALPLRAAEEVSASHLLGTEMSQGGGEPYASPSFEKLDQDVSLLILACVRLVNYAT